MNCLTIISANFGRLSKYLTEVGTLKNMCHLLHIWLCIIISHDDTSLLARKIENGTHLIICNFKMQRNMWTHPKRNMWTHHKCNGIPGAALWLIGLYPLWFSGICVRDNLGVLLSSSLLESYMGHHRFCVAEYAL